MIRCLAIVLLAVFVVCGRASAAGNEFCAGYVSRVVPVHSTDQSQNLGTDSVVAYQIRGAVATQISGMLDIYAGGDLYTLSFNNVQLPLRKKQLLDHRTGTRLMDYTEPESDPLYFRLPSATHVDAVWIAMAGNPSSVVECPTMPLTSVASAEWSGNIPESQIRAQTPQAVPTAVMTAHVDVKGCTEIYKNVVMTAGVTPEYPLGGSKFGPSMVITKVFIDAKAKVFDVHVFGSSGDQLIDQAVVRSAMQSKYQAARFLCVPIPGIYTLRANFDPH